MKKEELLIGEVQNADYIDKKCDIMAESIKLHLENNKELDSIVKEDKDLCKKIKRNLKIASVVLCSVSGFYFFNNHNRIVASSQEVFATIKEKMHESAQESTPEAITNSTPETASDSTSEFASESIPELNASSKVEKWIKFKLEDSNGYSQISDEEYEKLCNFFQISKNVFQTKMDDYCHLIYWTKS